MRRANSCRAACGQSKRSRRQACRHSNSVARFRHTLDARMALDGYIEQDAHGIITAWSAESERLYGWSEREAIGMRSHLLVPERNRARHDRALHGFIDAPERPILRLELTALHKDGHEFRVEFAISIEGREAALRVVASVRGIMPDEHAEEAFRQSERFRAILNQIQDGCSVVDLRGRYLFVNDAFCRMFGLSREAILGRSFRDTQNPIRHARTFEIFNQVFRTGEAATYEYQVSASHYIEQSIALEHDAGGKAIAFISIYRDCSARKRAEEALARARDSAEAANRAKSEFLANMSHEIRTPMNGIIGMTALMLDTPLTPQQDDWLQTIRGQAESLLGVVNDILDFSTIEAQRLELESIPFALIDAVHEAVAPAMRDARGKHLAFSSRLGPLVPAIAVGDPMRLKQVLAILLSNAVKFTERGSVTLDVSADAPLRDRVTIRFHVSDTGIGMGEDERRAIFEPFRQVDGSMTRRFGGTGLGLAIAATLAHLMDGSITVDSTPGAGSTFLFTATLRAASAEVSEVLRAAPPKRPEPARPSRILVAEDNLVNQRVAAGLLSKRGHTVTVVSNGHEALAALQRGGFDLVLMDVQMPDMDGFAATAAIRAWERASGSRVRIVAMTAHAMTGDRERCLAAGMDGYLAKPIDQRALYAAVEQ